MIALPNIWSTKLFYRYLSPKTLAYICIDERSIEKYGNHLDWDIKSKEKLTEKIILKFWDNININDFLDNYEQKYLIVLKKLGVRLAKYNLLIKHTNRYQSAMVTEQFAYEFGKERPAVSNYYIRGGRRRHGCRNYKKSRKLRKNFINPVKIVSVREGYTTIFN